MQDLSKEDLAKAESAGFPVVLLILLAVFGSLAAAALPLALGFVSVLITGALIFALSQVMEMSVFVTNMASMIGIGVAVDYSLFIVARYREEVAAGRPHDEARSVAMATSGLAVLFSGLTVIVSLAGLWMVDNQAIRSMALGAMLVVAVAMLGAATLLPAAARQARRAARPDRPPAGAAARRLRRSGSGWTDGVMRRPVLAVVSTTAVLLALAAPVLGMSTGTGALDQFPNDHEVAPGLRGGRRADRPGRVGADPGRGLAGRGAATRCARRSPTTAASRTSPPRSSRATATRCCCRPSRATAARPPAAKATVDRLRAALPAAAGRARRWTSAASPRRRPTSPTS